MNKIFEIALGIVTSIGSFLDVGAIATAAEAGSIINTTWLWFIANSATTRHRTLLIPCRWHPGGSD
ncbi:hypothetical protein [Nostoc sp.]|uniref:hypothetical protein n=1 Tax=Nostoc sp. TaxID=1180 RepID=UPI002FF59E13